MFFLLDEKERKNQENPKLLTHLLSHARRIFELTRFSCSAGIRLAFMLLKYSNASCKRIATNEPYEIYFKQWFIKLAEKFKEFLNFFA